MLFNTLDFVLFLPVIIIVYFSLHAKFRWIFLLAASYYFYMCWKPEYVLLIGFSTLIDYYCGLQMGKQLSKKKRKPFLILSLVANLGLLMGFKYFNFFSENLEIFVNQFDASVQLPLLDFLLPVGISFYTFQTLSYSIDVYRGKQEAEKHLGHFALYVSFFPQLVAGPIERFSSLSPQLKAVQSFDYTHLKQGLRLILFGLFTKMVIADNFAPLVDEVYKDPAAFGSSGTASAMLFYSFQIYCDFFGYSLIAIGSARIMGIHLMDNFKTPYLATGISDFWQRWHISLSTWFRDYVFLPMGGSRVTHFRWAFNILVVFLVSGFWHGANVTFILWGLIFAIAYMLEKGLRRLLKTRRDTTLFSLKHVLTVLVTFLIVTVAWVFFRSENVDKAILILTVLFSDVKAILPLHEASFNWTLLAIFVLIDFALFNKRFDAWIAEQVLLVRWLSYSLLIFAILVFAGVEDHP